MLPVSHQLRILQDMIPDAVEISPGLVEAPCPGADCHTTGSGKRDFRIWLSDSHGPHETCFHRSCKHARDAFMRDFYKRIATADKSIPGKRALYEKRHAAWQKAPDGRPAPVEPFDLQLAMDVADLNPVEVDDEWLLRHSPVSIPADPAAWPALLLDSLYRPGENILVFTRFASQGQVIHTVGMGTYRLEDYPPAAGKLPPQRKPTPFPKGANNGVWFLAAPVTGNWEPNPNNPGKGGAPKFGRRHASCATRFPYLVLESDEAPPEVWLRILTMLQAPVVAIYTSGGKSYHALVRVDAPTKEQFDLHRQNYITRLAAIGADPAAITAVRLTRLPGCLRFGAGEGESYRAYTNTQGQAEPRMQRLLYLNPQAAARPIISPA